MTPAQKEKWLKGARRTQKILRRVWMPLRPITLLVVCLLIVGGLVYDLADYGYRHYLMPPKVGSTELVEVDIEKGSSTNAIARVLEEHGIIRSKQAFKLYLDITSRGSSLKAGTYQLTEGMTIEQIVDALVRGDGRPDVTMVTIPEGYTVEEIAALLEEKGVLRDSAKFLELCKTGADYENFVFIQDAMPPFVQGTEETEDPQREPSERYYQLEGYLFPETYEFYIDADEDGVITKMLTQFGKVYIQSEKYAQRAQSLGMNTDEVVTLASMIEKEGKAEDFAKISAVFHNRLNQNMRLESDVPLQYILKKNQLAMSADDSSTESPYNTYLIDGLPVGPVCNPGQEALEAALYPDEAFMDEGYLYFCLKDPATGELDFSKTYEEHQAKVETYRPLWEAADQAQ